MKVKRALSILLLSALMVSLLTMLTGCQQKEKTAAEKWGIDKFVMVLLPQEGNPEFWATRKIFDEALSAVIGIPVEEYIATDYTACIEAMRTGQAQLADFGPLAYVFARERADAEALVNYASWNEATQEYSVGYYCWIIVRADSDIYTLDDLVGRSFGFVDPASTSGNLVPCHELLTYFNDKGYPDLTFEDLHVNGKFFSAATMTGTHDNAIYAVALGDIDAAGVASSSYQNLVTKGLVNDDEIRIICASPLIPTDPWAIKKTLPKELKDLVKQFLLDFEDPDFFAGTRNVNDCFLAVEDSAYDYLRDLRDRYNLSE